MTMYRVAWEIDVDAENPKEAAEKALAIQRDDASAATVFDVIEHDTAGAAIRVDLLEG